MYALSNLVDGEIPSWRAVKSSSDLAEGEIGVEHIEPLTVWDANAQAMRPMNEAEIEQYQAAKASGAIR